MPVDVGSEREAALSEARRLEILTERVEAALVEATTPAEVDRTVVRLVAEAAHATFAAVYRLADDGLTLGAARGLADGPARELVAEPGPAHTAVERRRTQVLGRDSEAGAGWAELLARAAVGTVAAVPVAQDEAVYRVLVFGDAREGVYGLHERDLLDALGRTVGETVDVLAARRQQRAIERLQGVADELAAAETRTAVAETAVGVASAVLDAEGVGVYGFDPEASALRRLAATDELSGSFPESVAEGPLWASYRDGERRTAGEGSLDVPFEAVSLVPLGRHGLLVLAATAPGGLDGRERYSVELLVAATRTALDGLASRETAERHRRALDERASLLDKLERASELRRGVDRALVDAGSRSELEASVCRRLAGDGPFGFAWLGTPDADGETVEVRARAGEDGGYLDAVSLATTAAEPAARALATGEVVSVADLTTRVHDADWAATAAQVGFGAACAVPLCEGDVTYGVLAVYDRVAGAFDGPVSEVLADLGRTVGHGINVVETRQGILADRTTELELSVPETGFLNAVSELVGEPVSYYELTPDAEGATRLLFALTDPPLAKLRELAEETVGVDGLRTVGSDGQHLFRATVAGDTVATRLVDCGGIPRRVTATGEATTAVVRLPVELSVRRFLDRLGEYYPGVTMERRRRRDAPARTREGFLAEVDAELTDRQREVLRTAYESGFFETPRETTGTELADLLGVSQPTVTRHLREGQRRVFALLFDEAM